MLRTRISQFISKVTNRPPLPIQEYQKPPSNVAKQDRSPRTSHGKANANDLFTAEFDINDVRIAARNILTKFQTHDEIAQYSGASISTRGRYISSAEKARGINDTNSRSLYLFIQSDTKQSLQLAIEKIKGIISNTQVLQGVDKYITRMSKYNIRPPLLMAPQQASNQSSTFIEKLMIGLEHAPGTFNVREQVIGVGGANLQYIRNETGAIATLRGRGSLFIDPVLGTESPEPLHLYIEHQRFDGLQAAKQLAKNLIETLQQEVVHLQQQTSQNSQNVTLTNNNTIIQQGQHVTHLSVPPPMLVPPPVIQQNPLEPQGNQATIMQQNFIQQNPPPNLSGPPPTVQSQQQTFIHQQIIPQSMPIQLQQSNVVIQQPVQQQSTTLANVNMPPPGIPIPIKTGQIVQFQTPPPNAATTAHLTQPPPNIQLQHQPQAATQIVLNPQQSYQYQYIQQPVQSTDPSLQPNQVTIQHIYQPQQQIQGIVQQAHPQTQTHQIHASQPQQYITVQGNTAYMMPPPTIIQQQQTTQQNHHSQMQAHITTSNPNLIFQPPPQLQQVQMQLTQGIPVQNVTHSLPANQNPAQQENLNQSCDETTSAKEDSKPDADQSESPQKSPKIKSEADAQSNDSDGENGAQLSARTNVTVSVPLSQAQTIAIKQQPPSVATSITLPMTQMAPPIMAVPPPMSCVQHFVGNTLITTHPPAQTHTQQIYTQVPVSIQQLSHTGQQIHVSAPNGQHFLVNATPHWQGTTSALTQQSPLQQITQNGTIQNVQIAATQSIAHNGTDFRALPPPTLVSHTNQGQHAQQHPLAVTFNPQVQLQFQPQLVQQLPPPQTIESTQIMSGHITSHPQHQFHMMQQQQQPQISYQQTVITPFPAQQQQQIKQMMYQEQIIRSGQKRKHESDDSTILNQQPRMGMGQRDQNQPMHTNQQQQLLHQAPPLPLAAHGNLPVTQTINGSSNNPTNAGQDENAEQKMQAEIQLLTQQAPPPAPPTSGLYSDNRSFYQRDMNDSFGDTNPRQHYEPSVNNGGGGVMLRGPRFHHNAGMMGIGAGHPMRPPFHMPPDCNIGNFPMHRMNFGPPPPPPPSYRGDCMTNINGNYCPPARFRGQW